MFSVFVKILNKDQNMEVIAYCYSLSIVMHGMNVNA